MPLVFSSSSVTTIAAAAISPYITPNAIHSGRLARNPAYPKPSQVSQPTGTSEAMTHRPRGIGA